MARFEIIDGRCVIPHGVTEILEEEFADCQELKEVVIPDTVVNIGMGAFTECHALQSVTIPNSVTKIPHSAFFWCTSLKEVLIPDSVKEIGPQAFEGCAKLRSVTIPEGVKELDTTFYQCSSLKEINIPSSVIEIGHNTFSACTRLERIDVADDNPVYKSAGNSCLTKDGRTLVFGCSSSVIPEGVKVIEDFAFYRCSRLRNITIPEGVEYIGNWSFGDCRKLESVNIPMSVKEIVLCAFSGTSIKDIFIALDDPDKCPDLIEPFRGRRVNSLTIHVPENSLYKYCRHPLFKKFLRIVCIP